MKQEREFLNVVSAVGYLNFWLLVFLLFFLKEAYEYQLIFFVPPLLTVTGSVVYYLLWDRFFRDVSKAEGRVFMLPYILSFTILVGAAVIILGLNMYAHLRG